MPVQCLIWGSDATESRNSDGDKVYVFSHRAGGAYALTGSAAAELRSANTRQRLVLTSWLHRQRRAGIREPVITTDVLSSLKTQRLAPVSQRVDRALLFFEAMRLDEEVVLFDDDHFQNDTSQLLAAATESQDNNDLIALFNLLAESGLAKDTCRAIGRHEYLVTIEGWRRVEELTLASGTTSSQAFVAMWFDATTDAAYENGIARAIANCGWRPMRIDNKEHVNKIDDEIIAEIRRSHFVVADFTCDEKGVRGGVYYEAGFAMGLNIPVIWTCQKESMKNVHFDTRQYSHIVWETPDDLQEDCKRGLVLSSETAHCQNRSKFRFANRDPLRLQIRS